MRNSALTEFRLTEFFCRYTCIYIYFYQVICTLSELSKFFYKVNKIEGKFALGLPTFCFAIPGHLNTGASNLFKPRAILAHQKYWQAKQMKHLNFCPKLIVISQKKKVLT